MDSHAVNVVYINKRNNSLPQDLISTTEIYFFFEDFPGKICFLSQTLPRFSFSMGFLSGTKRRVFFSWLKSQHGQHCLRDSSQVTIGNFFFPGQNLSRKTATNCSIQVEMEISGGISDSYNVLCISKSFLYGTCY